jgi:hypothetical protein
VGELRENDEPDGKQRTVANDGAINHVEHAVHALFDLPPVRGTREVGLASGNGVSHFYQD